MTGVQVMPRISSAVPTRRVASTRRLPAQRALLFAAIVGVAFLRNRLIFGSYPIDIPLALITVVALFDMTRRPSVGSDLLLRLWPWVWLILCASFGALLDDGFPEWAIVNLSKTVFTMLFFPAVLHFIVRYNLREFAIRAVGVGLVLTIFGLFTVRGDKFVRPHGFFPHPNYAAHYCFVAGVLLFFHAKDVRVRIVSVAAATFGIFMTSSFGAIVMIAVGLATYLVMMRPRRLLLLLALVAFPTGLYVQSHFGQTEDVQVTTSLNSDRFEFSRTGRIEIWSDMIAAWRQDPLGYGPDGTNAKDIGGEFGLESHNDWLGHLCERGPFGFLGLIGLWWALWRFAPKTSPTRLLLISLMVAGLLRETMTYRHVWVYVAICLAFDLGAQRTVRGAMSDVRQRGTRAQPAAPSIAQNV